MNPFNNVDWPKRLVLWGALTAVIFIFIWFAFELVLLAFAGVLLAIVLHTAADWVENHTPGRLGFRLSYTLAVLGILGIAGLVAYFVIPRAISEGSQIVAILPKSIADLKSYLDGSDWGRHVVHLVQNAMNSSGSTFAAGMSMVTSKLGSAVEGGVVVLVVGFYGALNAREDIQGLLRLFPADKRQRAKEVAGKVVYQLRWWMIGQLIPMAVLGVATMIFLWILHVPLAFTLGLVTGFMIFIPYVGSWVAFVPTVLVALTRGTDTALYVTLLYLGIHAAEGYALTPLVQKRAVRLPPIATILSQLLMWWWVGLLGVAVATPLAAAVLALIKTLYLHEEVDTRRAQQPSALQASAPASKTGG